jgi:hypothetical protein
LPRYQKQEIELLRLTIRVGAFFVYHPVTAHEHGVSGLAVTFIAIALAAVPPHEAASAAIFEAKVVGGSLFLALLGWIVFKRYQAKRHPVVRVS